MISLSASEAITSPLVARKVNPYNSLLMVIYLIGIPFVTLSQRYLTFSCDSFLICHYRALARAFSLLVLAIFMDRQGLITFFRHRRTVLLVSLNGLLIARSAPLMLEGMRYSGTLASSLAGVMGMPVITLMSFRF